SPAQGTEMVSTGLERPGRRRRAGGNPCRLPFAQVRGGLDGPGIRRFRVALSARQTKTRGRLPHRSRPQALVPGGSQGRPNQSFALATLLSGTNQGGPCFSDRDESSVSGGRLLSHLPSRCSSGQDSSQPASLAAKGCCKTPDFSNSVG